MPVKFENYARPARPPRGAGASSDEREWYRWRVFVDEKEAVLNTIKEVEYTLHPTFPKSLQVQTKRNPKDKFKLEAAGWGNFVIRIKVTFKGGSTEETSHFLDLSKGWPAGQ